MLPVALPTSVPPVPGPLRRYQIVLLAVSLAVEIQLFTVTVTPAAMTRLAEERKVPPGLPPIAIDGRWWWDGGIVSNTPLSHVLDNQSEPLLVFQVDLFSASKGLPRTIMDVMTREKEIRFSSRTRQVTDQLMRLRHDRELARRVLAKLPADLAGDPDVQALAARSAELPVSLVHLIYRPEAWESGARDFEFSARAMDEHWAAGREAVGETMANARLVAENILDGKTAAFDLTQR